MGYSLREKGCCLYKAATVLPSSGRGWPVGPGDGLLFARKSLLQHAGKAPGADYNIIRAFEKTYEK